MADPSPALVDALTQAVAALEAAEVPDDLRPVAFSKALDHLLGAPTEKSGGGPKVENGGESGDDEDVSTTIATIARKFKTEASRVSRVFEEDGEDLHLSVSRATLGSSQKRAMQEVALLIAGARQATGVDEDATALQVIRDHCDEAGVLDDGNFSRHMAERREGVRVKGSDRRRQLKVNQVGYESAGKLVERMTDGESK